MNHPTTFVGSRTELVELTDEQRAVYEWQLTVPGFGEAGQRRLAAASVMISRLGGVGGTVAYQLAAAGVVNWCWLTRATSDPMISIASC